MHKNWVRKQKHTQKMTQIFFLHIRPPLSPPVLTLTPTRSIWLRAGAIWHQAGASPSFHLNASKYTDHHHHHHLPLLLSFFSSFSPFFFTLYIWRRRSSRRWQGWRILSPCHLLLFFFFPFVASFLPSLMKSPQYIISFIIISMQVSYS